MNTIMISTTRAIFATTIVLSATVAHAESSKLMEEIGSTAVRNTIINMSVEQLQKVVTKYGVPGQAMIWTAACNIDKPADLDCKSRYVEMFGAENVRTDGSGIAANIEAETTRYGKVSTFIKISSDYYNVSAFEYLDNNNIKYGTQ